MGRCLPSRCEAGTAIPLARPLKLSGQVRDWPGAFAASQGGRAGGAGKCRGARFVSSGLWGGAQPAEQHPTLRLVTGAKQSVIRYAFSSLLSDGRVTVRGSVCAQSADLTLGKTVGGKAMSEPGSRSALPADDTQSESVLGETRLSERSVTEENYVGGQRALHDPTDTISCKTSRFSICNGNFLQV